MSTTTLDRPHADAAETERLLVTFTLADQLCGIPVLAVRDVLGPQPITRMPLAPPEIAGSLNLRGRIVTAIDLRARLRLPAAPAGAPRMSVVTEQGGELYAFLVDQVSAVMSVSSASFEPKPPSLPAVWAAHCPGVYRLEHGLLVELDVTKLLALAA